MIWKTGSAFFAGIVLVAGVTHLFGQADTASIHGTVVDPQNRPVAGANIVVNNTDLSSKRTTVADSAGVFVISNLAPGAFTVEATGKGLVSRRPVRLTISLGSTTEVTVKLSVAAVSQSTTVTGRGATSEGNTVAPPVNTDDAAAKIFFLGMEVTYLPNRDRDFSQFGQLAPGVKEDTYSHGVIAACQRSSALITQVYVVSFNDPLLGGRRGASDGTFVTGR
jgi:hypothetical protein